jgi:hypothetical protein
MMDDVVAMKRHFASGPARAGASAARLRTPANPPFRRSAIEQMDKLA